MAIASRPAKGIAVLRHLLSALIANAYPVATRMRSGYPTLSEVRPMIFPSQQNYLEHCVIQNCYQEFIRALWDEIGEHPSHLRLLRLNRRINAHGRQIWVGIGVEHPVFSKSDEEILKKLFSEPLD